MKRKSRIMPMSVGEWAVLEILARRGLPATANRLRRGATVGNRIYEILRGLEAMGLIEISGRQAGTWRDEYLYKATRAGGDVFNIIYAAQIGVADVFQRVLEIRKAAPVSSRSVRRIPPTNPRRAV